MQARLAIPIMSIGMALVGQMCVIAESASPAAEPVRYRYDPAGRRDPFVPLVHDGKFIEAGGLMSIDGAVPVLRGILWDAGGRSLALLNDTEARVGDVVNGYQVTAIRKDAVVLSGGGAPVVLKLEFEAPPSSAARTKTGEASR